MSSKSFDLLWKELNDISQSRPQGSSTIAELDAGVHFIGKKIVEEAAEVWMAAEHEDCDALALEISQLIYHLQVLMIARGITMDDLNERL